MHKINNDYKMLAYKIANGFIKKKPNLTEDIESAAMIGLWQASEKCNEVDEFKHFASLAIRNSIINELKRFNYNKKYYYNKGVKEPTITDIDDHYHISNSVNIEKEYFLKERDLLINKAIESLPIREQSIITGMFFNDLNATEVARSLGCSYQNIIKMKKRILRDLKQKLSN
jgi:RNA polymerase sporulation-specific sigma factor